MTDTLKTMRQRSLVPPDWDKYTPQEQYTYWNLHMDCFPDALSDEALAIAVETFMNIEEISYVKGTAYCKELLAELDREERDHVKVGLKLRGVI